MQEVSDLYSSPFLHTDEQKFSLRARKVFRGPWSQWNFWNAGFCSILWRKENRGIKRKTLGARREPTTNSTYFFTITAKIRATSLVNFYGQYADRHMNLKFMRRVSEREREIWQFVSVKVVCGSTATLTMLWRNSWSITGQTHIKLTSIF